MTSLSESQVIQACLDNGFYAMDDTALVCLIIEGETYMHNAGMDFTFKRLRDIIHKHGKAFAKKYGVEMKKETEE